MKRISIVSLIFMYTTLVSAEKFKPTWSSLERYEIPEWYEDAKFGIFIHWGVYSVPAALTEWYPRRMYDKNNEDRRNESDYQHHIKVWGDPGEFGYKDFIPMFTGEKYDPEAWVDLFVKSGAKFVMPVGEHHDAFAMYDSTFTDWNVVKMGPKRDVYKELVEEVRKRNLKVGISSHFAKHADYFEYNHKHGYDAKDPGTWGLYGPPPGHVPDTHLEDWYNRTREMIDIFEPDILYFDWMIKESRYQEGKKKIAAYYYNKSIALGKGDPGVVLTHKNNSYPRGTAVSDREHKYLNSIGKETWQTHTSVGRLSWGYRDNDKYRLPGRLVDRLIDIVSKNGVLLLNVGPDRHGVIIEEQRNILLEIGGWLEVNGEAIYNTRCWTTYGEGPTRIADMDSRVDFTSGDIRFTKAKDDSAVYAIVLDWPGDGEEINISSLRRGRLNTRTLQSITMLGVEDPLEWKQDAAGLKVTFPSSRPDIPDYAYTLKLTIGR